LSRHNETRTGPSDANRLTVVGMGASAGGIEALREFFGAVPADVGVAYVVIAHLAPDHKSELPAILSRCTKMPVNEIGDKPIELKANQVYVIPPDRKLKIADSVVSATPFDDAQSRRTSIDLFFRSLAAGHGDGFAIILSGGGSDGAVGAKAVKEAGGLVLVQDPREAAHEGMPRAVIAAEVADLVLPVRELAKRLANLVVQKEHLAPFIPAQSDDAALGEDQEIALKRIFDLVRLRTNHDFSRYKRATILRRLARRMQLNHATSLEQYLTVLKDSSEEVQSLFDDLLISVTSFFRDPAAWEVLRRHAIIPMLEQAQPNQAIRAWVPGCATGEEAYTLAMLFREEISRREIPIELVIFGSDVDQGALRAAREGLYPTAIATDVSEARLARFFRVEGDHYRIASEIRDSVVFAAHSVLRDPPFSKLHLISCRNLLIYLDRELQQQLQNVFRYGLRDDGYLFIGVSETADADLFEPLDKQHRIFRARARATGPTMRLPQLPAMPLLPAGIERGRERSTRQRRSSAEVHVAMLEENGPPSILLDEHWVIEHLSETAGRFLQPRGGAPSQVVTELVRPELVDELRSALHRAFELKEPCLSAFVPVRFNGTPRLVAVLVQPRIQDDANAPHVLVTFLEAGKVEPRDSAAERIDANDSLMLDLRDKLRIAEQRLESMRQEHGMAYEDLRAANEELQSLNEEYRSTTEELETSKEELQSVNEELQTVNHELKMKLEEVSRSNNDLENFMSATDIPMLFLDRGLCIKRYTAPLRQIFNVKSHDHGRPIGDLTHNLEYQDLERDAARVLHELAPIERQIKLRTGEIMMVRIRPYRTAEDKIDGVVVTFVKSLDSG
jgi:two-component system, chemotaxis family, CheB/CheR fusion protein